MEAVESFIMEQSFSDIVLEQNISDVSINVSNPHDTRSTDFDLAAQHKLLENTPAIAFTAILMTIGIPGNLLVCIVYRKWSNSTSTRVFLLSLAVLDLINCLVTSPTEIALMAHSLQFDFGEICKLSRFSTYFCNGSSALIMVAIAVDRYRRICTPSRLEMSANKARIIVVLLCVVSVIFSSPAIVLYGTQTFSFNDHNFRNIFAKNCLLEGRFINTPIPLSYFAFHCVTTIAIFTTVTVLYIFVGITIFQRWRFRKQFIKPTVQFHLQMIRNQSREDINDIQITRDTTVDGLNHDVVNNNQSTTHVFPRGHSKRKSNINIEKTALMLFLATMTYIISFLPFLGIAIHRSLYPDTKRDMSLGSEMVYQIFFRSYLLNSALDPIIYSFCNDQFRSECKKLLHIA